MTYRRVITALAFVATTAVPAFAGPPLLCHPFDIGTARSLPWDGSTSWFQGRSDYRIANLVADTQAILQPATPVVVRMETLRRAAIYASQDPAVAAALVQTLTAKATEQPKDALAALDAAYALEALHQVTMLGNSSEFRDAIPGVKRAIAGHDTAALVARAVDARPADPSVAFAAAMITLGLDRHASAGHAARARAGANADPLLARNLDHLS